MRAALPPRIRLRSSWRGPHRRDLAQAPAPVVDLVVGDALAAQLHRVAGRIAPGLRVDLHARAPVGAPQQLRRPDVGVHQRLLVELAPPQPGLDVDVVVGGDDGQALLVEALPPAGLDAAVVEDQVDVGERGRDVEHPQRVDVGRADRAVGVGSGVAVGDPGVDARGDPVLLGHLDDPHDVGDRVDAADERRPVPRRGHVGQRLADGHEPAGAEETVERVADAVDAPLLLAGAAAADVLRRAAGGDVAVGRALDDLEVELVGHPERRQQHAHVDAVAVHVVLQARGVRVGLEARHGLAQRAPLAAAADLGRALGDVLARREALRVDVRVDDEPACLHVA